MTDSELDLVPWGVSAKICKSVLLARLITKFCFRWSFSGFRILILFLVNGMALKTEDKRSLLIDSVSFESDL